MKKSLGLFIAISIYFFCCTPPRDTSTKEILNNSLEDFTIQLFHGNGTITDEIFIEKGHKSTIFFNYEEAETLTEISPCVTVFDSISFSNLNGKKLKINLMDEDNWSSIIKKGRSSHDQTCTLEITDDDLE